MPDIPRIWKTHRLVPLFHHCAFSCSVGAAKPEGTLKGLGVLAEDALFVGDGSDEELTGAAICGLRPVLVRSDRKDVTEWTGDSIESLLDLPDLIESGVVWSHCRRGL